MLAGIVAAIAFAAPALGAPANVTVRVEGDAATLAPQVPVTTTAEPVARDGHSCSGTSALGALDAATGGNWAGTYYDAFSDWIVDSIAGETHVFPDSWGMWVNSAYSESGLCSTELQEGDELLLAPAAQGPILELQPLPATVAQGGTVTVTVLEHGVGYNPDPPYDLIRTDGPAAGATVAAGGATATVGADGKAQLTFAAPGRQTVQATQAGHVRSAVRAVDVTAAPAPGAAPVPPPLTAEDSTAPVAAFTSLTDGRAYSRRRAPRELAGTVSADPSGLRSVRLSIRRQKGGKCWTYRDTTERFKRHAVRREVVLPHRRPGGLELPAAAQAAPRALHARRDGRGQGVQRVAHRDRGPGPVRRALPTLLAIGGVVLGATPAEAARTVRVMVAGQSSVLAGPQKVKLVDRTVTVGGKRCATGARTALSALAATKLPLTFKDYGACSRRPAESGSLYVRAIGGERERGSDGWVYKVGRRVGTTGAADPSGAFGDGRRLRTGQKVLWFWCVKDAADACQRTLEVTAPRSVTPGATFQATVRGYDENGKGVPVAGVEVAPGAVTDSDGLAAVTAPPVAGTLRLVAAKDGLVPAFPRKVVVR